MANRTFKACPNHPNILKTLFCLQCEEATCTECYPRLHQHHNCDSLKIVYDIRREETSRELEVIDQHINGLHQLVQFHGELEAVIKKSHADHNLRLQAAAKNSRDEAQQTVNKKDNFMKSLIRTSGQRTSDRDQLRAKFQRLSSNMEEFLTQRAALRASCAALMIPLKDADAVRNDPISFCEISSSLVPEVELEDYSIAVPQVDSSYRHYVDKFGYTWQFKFSARRPAGHDSSDSVPPSIWLHINNSDINKPLGNFQVVVKMLNQQTLRIFSNIFSFIVVEGIGQQNEIKIADVGKLRSDGLVSADNNVQLTIGIGPNDPITERRCNHRALAMHQYLISILRYHLENEQQNNFGYLRVENCPRDLTGLAVSMVSNAVLDRYGKKWLLKVDINAPTNKGFVSVTLSIYQPGNGRYKYIVEVVHPADTEPYFSKIGVHYFDERPMHLEYFMTMTNMLRFLDRNGTLTVRFATVRLPVEGNNRPENQFMRLAPV